MSAANAIETNKLRKVFGDYAAVKGLTLQVMQGEVFGFLGPNGAGKTTSMKMLAGIGRTNFWFRVVAWKTRWRSRCDVARWFSA